jgi:hypothetical protein
MKLMNIHDSKTLLQLTERSKPLHKKDVPGWPPDSVPLYRYHQSFLLFPSAVSPTNSDNALNCVSTPWMIGPPRTLDKISGPGSPSRWLTHKFEQTRSPTFQCVTFVPTETTSPAMSEHGIRSGILLHRYEPEHRTSSNYVEGSVLGTLKTLHYSEIPRL